MSVDALSGNIITYPLLSDSVSSLGSSYKIAKMACVTDSNYIISLVYRTAPNDAQEWLILVYSTDTVSSRSKLLHSMITLPANFTLDQTPYLVAS